MIRTALLAAAAATAALPAQAQMVRDCDRWEANARNVVWTDPPRSFASGDILLIALDTGGEPACCSYHVMVLHPDPDGFQACALVSGTGGGAPGWTDVTLSAASARYDPARGLTVTVPVATYDGTAGRAGLAEITVNSALGEVTAR